MSDLLCFVETTVFTKRISALGLEDSLRRLQLKKQLREIATQIKRQP